MKEDYQQYLESPHWLTLRYLKRLRARQCGVCVELSDLRVMCRRCHFLAHELFRAGAFRFDSTNHHHRWARIKAAVKKHLGVSTRNMFAA
jgi:hypothetical protein